VLRAVAAKHPYNGEYRLQEVVMKRIVYTLIAVLFAVLPFGTGTAQAATTISVTGDAQVNVVPDEVIITLGIETSDKVLKTAKNENDQRVAQVIATIKDLG